MRTFVASVVPVTPSTAICSGLPVPREPAILRREGSKSRETITAHRSARRRGRKHARKPTSSPARRGTSACSSDRSHEADTFAPDLGARLVGLGPFAQVVERQAGHGGEIHRAGPGYAIVVTRVSCVRQAETGRLLAIGLCVLIEFDALENVNPSFKNDANVVAMPPR